MLKSYRELEVWQKAFDLSKEVYRLTATFPADERFGLIAQLRRAAVSIAANIAEGYNRGSRRDYVRFLWIAYGSVAEIETELLLARDLQYGDRDRLEAVLPEVARVERMLHALIRALENKKD